MSITVDNWLIPTNQSNIKSNCYYIYSYLVFGFLDYSNAKPCVTSDACQRSRYTHALGMKLFSRVTVMLLIYSLAKFLGYLFSSIEIMLTFQIFYLNTSHLLYSRCLNYIFPNVCHIIDNSSAKGIVWAPNLCYLTLTFPVLIASKPQFCWTSP